MPLKFYAKSNILVIGPTGCGKTTAVLRIIEEKLIEPMPEKIFYMYAAHQPFMDEWNNSGSKPEIEFVRGVDLNLLENYEGSKLVVFDDLILSISKEIAQRFIAGSHHNNTTTILISHAIYLNNEHYRLMKKNTHYVLIFKDKRYLADVKRYAATNLCENSHRLIEAYKYISAFDFVLLSFENRIPEQLLVTADFFSKWLSVFL